MATVTKIRAEGSESLLNKKSASSIASSETFNFADHGKNAFEVIKFYFNDPLLKDLTLVIGSKRINVHRLVLSASSLYFATMFKGLFKESSQNEIEIKEFDEDALLALVQYCYTGSIELREDNIEIMFVTARLLQIDPVVEVCSQFLIKRLDPINCLGVRTFADAQGCDSLSNAAHAYALKYFVQVIQNQEFLELSVDKVAEFLKSDDVNVPSEETIFNALTTWLKRDSINRIKEAYELLSYVRLPLLMPEFIVDNIQGNELFNDQKTIQDLILEAFTYHLLRKPTDSLLKSGRTRPRKSTVGILLAFGEYHQKEGSKNNNYYVSIDGFDLRDNTWRNITEMRNRGEYCGVVCFEEKLFFVGGELDEMSTNSVECFNFSNQSWETWPSMQICRNEVEVGILNGFLYAVGGSEDFSNPTTVERCDLVSQKWSFVAPMSTGRNNAGVAVLNDKLYVVGGWSDGSKTNTMECYDPKTNKWTFCSPMSEARDLVATGVLNGYIYVIGEPVISAERYDPKTDKWTTIAPMNDGRDDVGLGVLGNRLFALSNDIEYRDWRTTQSSFEAYDPALNEWQEFAPLKIRKSKPCAVLDRTILSKYWIDFFSRSPI